MDEVIGLDADGVLLDFRGHFQKRLSERVGYQVPISESEYDSFLLLDAAAKMAGEEMLRDPSFWSSMPPLPGAREAVRKLRALSIDIVVITAPWESCAEWLMARKICLRRNFGIPPEDILSSSGKRKDLVGNLDVFVEDKPDNLERWSARNPHGFGILMDQPYNRDSSLRRMTWAQFCEASELLPEHLKAKAQASGSFDDFGGEFSLAGFDDLG